MYNSWKRYYAASLLYDVIVDVSIRREDFSRNGVWTEA